MWSEDKRHGYGVETNPADKSRLTGTFHRGRLNGDAILEISNGYKYSLKYNNGVLVFLKESFDEKGMWRWREEGMCLNCK